MPDQGEEAENVGSDAPGRSSPPPWVPLLRRLTEISPGWGVWKNADRAIRVSGDIDAISPPADRTALLGEFSRWAREHGFGPLFVCRHLPGSVLGVAVRERRELVELQLSEEAIFRGATLFIASDVANLMMMDARGFRHLRPGSEGLLLLFHNGMKRGGRPSLVGQKADRLLQLMAEDPEGMDAATHLFGSVQRHALRLATAALDGVWRRRDALTIEMWASSRALKNPRLLTARAAYRLRGDRYCPLLPVLRSGRQLVGEVDEWLNLAKRTHPSGLGGPIRRSGIDEEHEAHGGST